VIALRIDPRLGGFAQQMRREPTPFENAVWQRLRASQLGGFKFRRQTVIGSFICDFFCSAKALVVEIDGDTHDPEADMHRDGILASKGFEVLRFTNADVKENLEAVLAKILERAQARFPRFTHPPTPSLEREGEF
jgi:very-short-patch-repair endonuclease